MKDIVLDVAYRGSPEPQIVDVGVELDGTAAVPLAPWAIGSLVRCIQRGLAGGAELAPELGSASLEAGPTGEGAESPDELGPRYAFRLSVRGMSPRFVRVIAEHLATCGAPSAVRSITVVGSLPPDGGPLSVRERELRAWLADPNAYPGVWRDPGFPVAVRSVPRGAAVRVTIGNLTDAVARELEETFSSWQDAILTCPNARQTGRGLMAPHASFARTRTELCAKVALFDHAQAPARSALVNALARFHRVVAPITAVDIAMP